MVDFWDGTPIGDAAVWWTHVPEGLSHFVAGPWNGHEDIVLVEAPNEATMRVEADGYVPRVLVREPDLEPDEFAVLQLEPVDSIEVWCTLDGEPCDPHQVDVLSSYYRALGSPEEGWCEPSKPLGTYDCPAGRVGLCELPLLVPQASPRLEVWREGRNIGSQSWEYPLAEPVLLEISTEKAQREGPRSHVCAEVVPPQGPGCAILVAPGQRSDVGNYSVVRQYSSGTTRDVDVAAGTEALLTCPDGTALVLTRDAGCDDLELEPYGSVCVEHEPALRCNLTRPAPYPFVSVTGCHGEVPAGTWSATCHGGEVDGENDWVKCEDIEVVSGETTDLRCW